MLSHRLAGRLCTGALPVEKIRVHLTDFVVDSIRDMPEHRYLITNWSAILKAMRFDRATRDISNREEITRQRILLRMLARAAELEIGKGDDDGKGRNKRRRVSSGNGQPHEALSVVLLKSLPQLLEAFKGDLYALRSLTTLPGYLIPAVFSLPSRKAEFNALVKGLCATFLDVTDEKVLQNLAFSLSRLVQGGHARVSEVRTALKKLSVALRDRSMDLFSCKSKPSKGRKSSSPKRRSRSSDASRSSVSTTSEAREAVDNEHSLRLCLQRLRILTKQCGVEQLFGEDEELEGFFNAVGEGIAQRLQDRKPVMDDDETSTVVPEIWTKGDPSVHGEVAHAIDEGLNLLLGIAVWTLFDVLNKLSSGTNKDSTSKSSDAEMQDTMDEKSVMLLRLRDRLVKLIAMCFDQTLREDEDIIYSDEHHEFVAVVLSSAGRVSSDVRSLFAREWKQSADPVRRSLALTEDSQLLGGFSGFLQSRYSEVCII